MSSASHEPLNTASRRSRASVHLLVRDVWAGIAIVAIWVAVLFTAVFGPNVLTTSSGGDGATIPSAVVVALFASLATWAVAKYGFGHRNDD